MDRRGRSFFDKSQVRGSEATASSITSLLGQGGAFSSLLINDPATCIRLARFRKPCGPHQINPKNERDRDRRISRILSETRSFPDDHFSWTPVARRLQRPTRESSRIGPIRRRQSCRRSETGADAPLFGLAPGGVCRARPVTRPAGELLPRRFTLTPADRDPRGGLFSVALSLPVTGRWALPTTAPCGVRTFLRGLSSGPRRHGPERPGGHPACHDPLSIVSPTGTFLHPFPPMRRRSHASVDANSPLQPPQGNLRDFSPKFPIYPR